MVVVGLRQLQVVVRLIVIWMHCLLQHRPTLERAKLLRRWMVTTTTETTEASRNETEVIEMETVEVDETAAETAAGIETETGETVTVTVIETGKEGAEMKGILTVGLGLSRLLTGISVEAAARQKCRPPFPTCQRWVPYTTGLSRES